MAISELIERLEKATGPDRELDAEIACHLFGESGRDYWAWQSGRPQGTPQKPVLSYWRNRAEKYTASIDAGLTLVPPNFHWNIESRGGAFVSTGKPPLNERVWAAAHDIPAIALCIAALRARAALAAQGTE